jgi:hypothetical protein
MAKKKNSDEPILNAIQDLLIVQLALSGVDNHSIRKVAGVQMSKVTRISKILRKRTKAKGSNNG